MNRPLKLNKRLTAAAEQVRPGAVAADIGTDHGYLACALVLSGRCRKVYAADLNREPLERAEATIARRPSKSRIFWRTAPQRRSARSNQAMPEA